MELSELLKCKDDEKIKHLNEFSNDIQKEILDTFKSKEKWCKSLFYTNKDMQMYILEHVDSRIIETFLNFTLETKKVEYLKEACPRFQEILLSHIKQYWLNEEILKTLDDDVKIHYLECSGHTGIRHLVLSTIKDKKRAIELISTLNSHELFRFISINKDPGIAKYLLSIVTDPVAIRMCKSNIGIDKVDRAIKDDIDKDITIGVELECCSEKYYDYRYNINFFNQRFQSHSDGSVTNGVEVVSPILHYTKEDLNQLEYVCDTLHLEDFHIDRTCGGHIHLGANYFKNSLEFSIFLNLYSRIEDILFIITNRKNKCIRRGTFNFARGTLDVIRIYNLNFNKEKIMEIGDCYKLLKDDLFLKVDRYHALNLTNLGNPIKNTIEFRMPNGELDFNELLLNIRLLCKIFMVVKEIAYGNNIELNNKYEKLLSELSQEGRFETLMDMLFINKIDKEPYIERYKKNKVKFSPVRVSNAVSFYSRKLTKKI